MALNSTNLAIAPSYVELYQHLEIVHHHHYHSKSPPSDWQ
jgi:hypothetical protein